MKLGMNAGAWSQALTAGITPAVWRGYCTPDLGVPAAWNHTSNGTPPSGPVRIISIEPDITEFMAGNLDTAIAQWVSGAMPGDCPVAYHEADSGKKGLDAASCVALQQRFHQVVKTARPDLVVGQITEAYSAEIGRLPGWIAPGMDYQGCDGYKPKVTPYTVTTVLQAWLKVVRAADVKVPIAVTETNCVQSGNTRPTWFKNAHTWALNHDCLFFNPFYGADYPWDASDTTTINLLKSYA